MKEKKEFSFYVGDETFPIMMEYLKRRFSQKVIKAFLAEAARQDGCTRIRHCNTCITISTSHCCAYQEFIVTYKPWHLRYVTTAEYYNL